MLSIVFTNGHYTPDNFYNNGKGDKHDYGAGFEDVWYKSNQDGTVSISYYELTSRFNSGYKFPIGESYDKNMIFIC